jgi:hypothetical protein
MHPWALLLPFAVACTVSSDPCDDYVDYMCDCHPEDADDPDGVDCEDLATQFPDTDPKLEEHCIAALDAQLDKDEANDWECPA